MEESDREGADGIETARMIVGGAGAPLPALRTADGYELVSLDDASDIVRVARFMRDYEGPGLDAECGVEAMKGLAALLDPRQQPSEDQKTAVRDILGSIAFGTLSAAAPELCPSAISLLKHFVDRSE